MLLSNPSGLFRANVQIAPDYDTMDIHQPARDNTISLIQTIHTLRQSCAEAHITYSGDMTNDVIAVITCTEHPECIAVTEQLTIVLS